LDKEGTVVVFPADQSKRGSYWSSPLVQTIEVQPDGSFEVGDLLPGLDYVVGFCRCVSTMPPETIAKAVGASGLRVSVARPETITVVFPEPK
jgi:hypothetical protein